MKISLDELIETQIAKSRPEMERIVQELVDTLAHDWRKCEDVHCKFCLQLIRAALA